MNGNGMFWIAGWWEKTWQKATARAELIGASKISQTLTGETDDLKLFAEKSNGIWMATGYTGYAAYFAMGGSW